jgi:hypothetical protein
MRDTSKIWTGICGKSHGTQIFSPRGKELQRKLALLKLFP